MENIKCRFQLCPYAREQNAREKVTPSTWPIYKPCQCVPTYLCFVCFFHFSPQLWNLWFVQVHQATHQSQLFNIHPLIKFKYNHPTHLHPLSSFGTCSSIRFRAASSVLSASSFHMRDDLERNRWMWKKKSDKKQFIFSDFIFKWFEMKQRHGCEGLFKWFEMKQRHGCEGLLRYRW